ncbi:hypothetical protein HK405_001563, partial [Cladochytrium tenue]
AVKATRRAMRFCAWSGQKENLMLLLQLSAVRPSAKELAVPAAYAVIGRSADCLLPILAMRAQMERNHHQTFYQAVRSEQIHLADLLLNSYYK